jgi:hypothetical protein
MENFIFWWGVMGGNSHHCSKRIIMAVIDAFCEKFNYLLYEIEEYLLLCCIKSCNICILAMALEALCSAH